MTRMLGPALLLAGSTLIGSACSDEFSDCKETRTCKPTVIAGGAGEGGATTEQSEGGAGGTSVVPVGGAGGSCDGIACNGVCTDTDSDPEHCGDCKTSCGEDQPLCVSGECAARCPADAPEQCGNSCADFQTDPIHCGDCDTECPEPKAGSVATCVAGKCDTECLDPCPAVDNGTAACVDDACVAASCDPGFKLCNGKCVDPAVDNSCGGHPLSTGNGVACAIKAGGAVWCWSAADMATPKQVANLSGAIQLSVYEEACALKGDGTIWCWQQAGSPTPASDVSAGMKFKQIAVSKDPSCHYAGVGSSGKVFCWDGLKWVQKGTATASHVSVFPASAKAAGFVRTSDGAILKWPSGEEPANYHSSGYSEVSAGADDSLVFRTTAGTVTFGESVVDVGELEGSLVFRQVTAGSGGGCALDADGKIGCWGLGAFGQLGNNDLPTSSGTTMVQFGGSGFRAQTASRGPLWTCALKTDGTVWCAGKDTAKAGTVTQANILIP